MDDLHARMLKARTAISALYGAEAMARLTQTPKRLMRVSAQIYNTAADYERLAEALLRCPAY